MGIVWDHEPSEELREIYLKNMKRLGLVLSDMCYLSLYAFSERRGRPPTKPEMIRIMDTELSLVVEQNIEEESWREMIYKLAEEKYRKSGFHKNDKF